jgi:deazaflavin-dependent oxidoreductase (nitroreductase family)
MWYNSIIAWLLRSPFHGFVSKNMMLISYTGRKSGKSYTIPVNYLCMEDEEGEFLAITSQKERVWWRNLRGGLPVSVFLQGHERSANAEVIEDGGRVAQNLLAYFQHAPQLARYFGVGLNEDNQPIPEDVSAIVQDKVFIKARLT